MKTIKIDEVLHQYLLSKALTPGETLSAILTRELKIMPPLVSVEIEDNIYSYVASKAQQIGESATSILRRELGLDGEVPPTPHIVEFRIVDGTANNPWNTSTQPVLAAVGDTLRVVNHDSVSHQLHTSGVPFPHPMSAIAPGESADYVLVAPFDPAANQFLYDHLQGPSAQFWLKVLPPH